jgi:hypothetical protein
MIRQAGANVNRRLAAQQSGNRISTMAVTIARNGAPSSPRATPKESFLGRLLDPIDRLSESIFSILILLTFTLAFRIIKLGGDPHQQIPSTYMNELLIGAAGATLAWGIIDGIMYALMEMFARGERHRLLRQLQTAHTDEEGVQIVANELDYILEPITGEEQRKVLYQDVLEHLRDGSAQPVRLTRRHRRRFWLCVGRRHRRAAVVCAVSALL